MLKSYQQNLSKNSLAGLTALAMLLTILSSCATESTPSYELTTSSVPAEGGTVSPASGEHDEGTEVQLEATANENWVFDGWEGNQTGSQNPVTVTMDSDKDIRGRFVKIEYPLTITNDGEGTVTETIVQNKMTDYEYGTLVQLEANSSQGWQFLEWLGDLAGSENPATLMIDGPKNVTAVFEINEYNIILETSGPGTASVDPDKETYQHGETVTFEAMPNANMEFLGWFGTFEEFELIYEHQMMSDVDVTAFFSTVENAFVVETLEIDVVDGLVDRVLFNVTNFLLEEVLLMSISIADENGVEVGTVDFEEPVPLGPRTQNQGDLTFDFETTDEETFKMWEVTWTFEYKGDVYSVTQEVGEPSGNAKRNQQSITVGRSITIDIKQ